jgi:teichoic acid transport system ATP-binding protein
MGILNQKYIKAAAIQTNRRKSLIHTENIGVKYILGSKREDIQSRAFDIFLKRSTRKVLWALQGINLIGYSGDIIGVVGSNGAGKTTLCRVICGILRPDVGRIRVEGKISALLTLGTGFNADMSGIENIFLNGMMLGFSKRYIKVRIPEIIEFSGLSRFVDEPIKKYSAGMKTRLAFSIAAIIEPDILIIDEALSAGDLEFNEKAGKKLQQIILNSKMVIVVTHQITFVEKFCTKALWLHEGTVREYGNPIEVAQAYKGIIPQFNTGKRLINIAKTKHKSGEAKVIRVDKMGVRFWLNSAKDGYKDKQKPVTKKLWQVRYPFWALKGVTFTLNEGDILGIIGRNGAGKTTLCRLISGILKPDRGKIIVDGRITAVLSFGTGFNMQLSGRDNIFLNGMLIGISKKALMEVYADIVDFSGIGKFIEEPVKNYSMGMISRLGFSIAAMLKPDIFIIDEALSAGDISFYEKASTKIQELITQAKSVIVVTHSMPFVETVCTRAIWIENNTIRWDGKPKETVQRYRETVNKKKK